jgi:hypothetical protein
MWVSLMYTVKALQAKLRFPRKEILSQVFSINFYLNFHLAGLPLQILDL